MTPGAIEPLQVAVPDESSPICGCGSFVEMLDVIGPLADPATRGGDPADVFFRPQRPGATAADP